MKMTATILEFRHPECKRAETDAHGSSQNRTTSRSAEIIIFPGVRIERQSGPEGGEPSAKPRKPTKRAARRKL